MSKNKKQKKEKVIWYDDNSTLADMSSVNPRGTKKEEKEKPFFTSSSRDKFNTFLQTFKMMLIPTGVALLILGLLYGIMILIVS